MTPGLSGIQFFGPHFARRWSERAVRHGDTGLSRASCSFRAEPVRWSRNPRFPGLGYFYRPSVTSLFWATLDLLTVALATTLALRFRVGIPTDLHAAHTYLHDQRIMFIYIAWFGMLLVVLARSYGLYGPILSRNGLNEQRLDRAGLADRGPAAVRNALSPPRRDGVPRSRNPSGFLHNPSLPPPRRLAQDRLQPLSRGPGNPQCSHRWRRPRRPRAAQSPGIAPPPRLPLQGLRRPHRA
jgi:hypothetical protein